MLKKLIFISFRRIIRKKNDCSRVYLYICGFLISIYQQELISDITL